MKNYLLVTSQIALIAFLASCGIKATSTKTVSTPPSQPTKDSSNATAPSDEKKEEADLSLKSGLIGAGGNTTCLSSAGGDTYCWGKNDQGQAGSKYSKNAPLGPQNVATGSMKAISVALGNAFSCIMNEFSLVKCWGANDNSQIGISDTSVTNQPSPSIVSVSQAASIDKAYLSDHVGCAYMSTGVVQCWGLADNFRLGIDNTKIAERAGISGSFSGEVFNSTKQEWEPRTRYFTSIPITIPDLTRLKVKEFYESRIFQSEDGEFYCNSRDYGTAFCQRETGKDFGKIIPPAEKKIKFITGSNGSRYVLTEDNMVYATGGNYYGITGNPSIISTDWIGWNYTESTEFNKFQIKSLPRRQHMSFQMMCIITTSGGVKCLGRNYGGMLGNGKLSADNSNGFSRLATDVVDETGAPITNVTNVYLGYPNNCALKEDTSLWCWGRNEWLTTIGINTSLQDVPYAVKVIDSGVVDVYMYNYLGCALMNDKNLKCWGRNWLGTMGLTLRDNQKEPVTVPEFNGNVERIIPGGNEGNMCVITTGGNVACLGSTRWGVSGRPWIANATDPRKMEDHVKQTDFGYLDFFSTVKDGKKLSAGNNHACMIANDTVRCWGGNDKGQLGIGSTVNSSEPTFMRNIYGKAIDVAAAGDSTCVVNDRGEVYCAGDNSKSQLAQSAITTQSLIPVKVNIDSVVGLGGGRNHMCAISKDGQVLCWGDNISGQLGDKSFTRKSTPSKVEGLSEKVLAIAGGDNHTCALLVSGKVACWGDNQYGQLGTGNNKGSSTAMIVQALASKQVESLAVGNNHTCVQTTEKKSYCWGANTDNQLGTKDKNSSNVPVLIQMDK